MGLLEKCESYQAELKELQKKWVVEICVKQFYRLVLWRVSSLESEHSTAMSNIVTTMKTENEQKLTETVEAVREDERNRFTKEMEEMKQHIEEDKAQTVMSIQEQLKILQDVSYHSNMQ